MNRFQEKKDHPLMDAVAQLDQAIGMIESTPITGDDPDAVRRSVKDLHEQALSLLRSLGRTIVSFIGQDEKAQVARDSRASKSSMLASSLPAGVVPESAPNSEEDDLKRLAADIFSASFGGAHKITPDTAFEMARAFIVEQSRNFAE